MFTSFVPGQTLTAAELNTAFALAAPLASPTFTGTPSAPTPAQGDQSNALATTAFVGSLVVSYATLNSPAFTGTPTAPNPPTGDNSATLATTAFVKAQNYAPIASPTFTGVAAAPTPPPGVNSTQIATTAFVATSFAPINSPVFTGTPSGPQPPIGDISGRLATTQFVEGTLVGTYAPLASPAFTGNPTAPTPTIGDNSNAIATTAFVQETASGTGFAPINSPTFTGIPAGPTAAPGTNTTQLATTSFVATSYLPINNPSWTGVMNGAAVLTLQGGIAGAALNLAGNTSTNRALSFYTVNVPRWALTTNNTAEGGSNAGSDFTITPYADGGGTLPVALSITRSSGLVSIPNLSMGANSLGTTQAQGNPNNSIATTLYVAQRGMQSSGQQQINNSTTLTQAQAGSNILLENTPGMTITFPSSPAMTFILSNLTGGNVNLVFPTGTDYRNFMTPGEQVTLAGDGGGFYRVVSQGGGLQVLYSTTLAAATPTITIPNIPQNYRHLRLVIWGQTTTASVPVIAQFNGDGGNNYSFSYIQATNAALVAGGSSAQGASTIGNMSNFSTFANQIIVDILGYSNTHFAKCFTSVVYEPATAVGQGAILQQVAGSWSNVAAITQIVFSATSSNFAIGTEITLYGMN